MPLWPLKLRLKKSEPFILHIFSSTRSFFQCVFSKRRPETYEPHFLILRLEGSWMHPSSICLHGGVVPANHKSSRRAGTSVGYLVTLPSIEAFTWNHNLVVRGEWSQTAGAAVIHSLSISINNICLQNICRGKEWLRTLAVVDRLGESQLFCWLLEWPWTRTYYLLKSWFLYLEFKKYVIHWIVVRIERDHVYKPLNPVPGTVILSITIVGYY